MAGLYAANGGYNVTTQNISEANAQSPTYLVAGTGFVSYATPTDMFSISGSDTKTVRIINVTLAIQSTAIASATWFWIKRTTADTGGSPTTPTPIAIDSTDGAATAVVKLFTAAPSALGTSAGNLLVQTIATAALTGTATIMIPMNYLNGGFLTNCQSFNKPLTLHGSAESFCLNFNGAALPAGFTGQYLISWTES